MTQSTPTLTKLALTLATLTALSGCEPAQRSSPAPISQSAPVIEATPSTLMPSFNQRLGIYHPVALTSDLSHLSQSQHSMISKLIDAAKIMDALFWQQAYGSDKAPLLAAIDDPRVQDFVRLNYGPWDRLQGDAPFLSGVAAKSPGAQFYPADMTKEEFEQAEIEDKKGLYSVIRRDADGKLVSIRYSQLYKQQLQQASKLLLEAAAHADNPAFANYLTMRSRALLTDDYQPSDFAWMAMKDNPVDMVVGPIETYEDQLFGYRAAFEAYVLIKDQQWSEQLARYAAFLPQLQQGLPVEAKYKQEVPGTDADLNAYDVIYYAGHANAGSKTIAINLPNDEQVQLEKGTRRLQLKNAMRAKFDHILVPIADELIDPKQRKHITFDAFFANTMFHEVAHGLGIKNTVNAKGTVRQSLKEHASALEEGKADILGLYMITKLYQQGEIQSGALLDNYVTFMAGIFRSVRFGASSAHGKANMVRFNYFQEHGAFSRDVNGRYRVDFDKMQLAMTSLSQLILTLQGNGDYQGVDRLISTSGMIKPQLAADLTRLGAAGIPVDIVFQQGKKQLGLQ